MPKINKYNVYDNGELVMTCVTHREIAKKIGCSKISIPAYIESGHRYDGRYTFELCENEEKMDTFQEVIFKEKWNEVVGIFKNVIWVKSGGKRLKVGGKVKCG